MIDGQTDRRERRLQTTRAYSTIMNNRDEVEVTVEIFTEPEVTNCFSTIALVIIRENQIKFL